MIDRTTLQELLHAWPQFCWPTDPQPQINSAHSEQLSDVHRHYLDFYRLNLTAGGTAKHYNFGSISIDQRLIAVQSWHRDNARGTIICVHGYWEHAGLLPNLIQHCLSEGFNVVAFDEPGHGLSQGTPVTVDSFSEYTRVFAAVVDRVVEPMNDSGEKCLPLIAIGHSNGGAVLLDYFFSHHNKWLDQTIVLSPLIRIFAWSWFGFGLPLLPTFWQELPRVIGHAGSQDRAFAKFVAQDPLQTLYCSQRWLHAAKQWLDRFLSFSEQDGQLVFIQGTWDTTVDWKFNLRELKKRAPQLRAHTIKKGYHNLSNEREPYRSQCFSLLTNELEQFQ